MAAVTKVLNVGQRPSATYHKYILTHTYRKTQTTVTPKNGKTGSVPLSMNWTTTRPAWATSSPKSAQPSVTSVARTPSVATSVTSAPTTCKQQDDDSNSASPTTDPNAKPSPPVGTASPAQTNPTCNYNSVDQFSIGDVQDAHNFLAQEGYGNNNDNCCTGDKGACGQLAVSGGVTIQMCGPPSSGVQCAACANIAIALNVLNVDCQKDYKMGGTEGIPYLDGVTLELAAPVVT